MPNMRLSQMMFMVSALAEHTNIHANKLTNSTYISTQEEFQQVGKIATTIGYDLDLKHVNNTYYTSMLVNQDAESETIIYLKTIV